MKNQESVQIPAEYNKLEGPVLRVVVPRKPPIDKIIALYLIMAMVKGFQQFDIRFRSLSTDDEIIKQWKSEGYLAVGVGSAKYNDRLLPNGSIARSDTAVVSYALGLRDKLQQLVQQGQDNSPEAQKIRLLLKLEDLANRNNEEGILRNPDSQSEKWHNDYIGFVLRQAYNLWDEKSGVDDPHNPTRIVEKVLHVIDTCCNAHLCEPRIEQPRPDLAEIFTYRFREVKQGNQTSKVLRHFSISHYAWGLWQTGSTEQEIDTLLGEWRKTQDGIAKILKAARDKYVTTMTQIFAKDLKVEQLVNTVFGVEQTSTVKMQIHFFSGGSRTLLVMEEEDSNVVAEFWKNWSMDDGDKHLRRVKRPDVIINRKEEDGEMRFVIMTKNNSGLKLEGVQDTLLAMGHDQQKREGVPNQQLKSFSFHESRKSEKSDGQNHEINRIFVNGSDFWLSPGRLDITLEKLIEVFKKNVVDFGDPDENSARTPNRWQEMRMDPATDPSHVDPEQVAKMMMDLKVD